ncbi:MAG: T9SS type A sorting domain-containing protein [Bacteroidales bacterium]|nr:T9SS type A sorting domain-containing protein [Bacteroidales bacterium]
MKNIILIIIIFIAVYSLHAQNPNFEWVKSNQGYQGNANAISVELDSAGNIYTIGSFSGTVDFNPSVPLYYGLTSGSYWSYYIQKLDSNGNLLWVRQIDFTDGHIKQFNVSQSGQIYIAGTFQDSVDIDPEATTHMLYSNGEYDVFILKLSANGNFLWAKSFGGSANDFVRDVAVDSHGNIYSHGSYKDTVDFDPGPGICLYGTNYNPQTSTPIDNAFIQKLDKDGNFVWAKAFVCGEGSLSNGLTVDINSEDNVYCAGYFFGSNIDFDPGAGVSTPPSNNSSMYFVKLDSMGSFVWAKFSTKVGTYGLVRPNAIKIDRFNNIYTTGTIRGSVDFDPGPDTLLLSENTFIQKYDENGNFLWAKSYGYVPSYAYRENTPTSLATDTFGNVYSTGYFNDSTDLDPGFATMVFYASGFGQAGYGAYIQKLNTNGELLMAGVISNTGLPNSSRGKDVSVDNTGNIFATGDFGGTVDFDIGAGVHNQSSPPNRAATYILKLSQCKTLTTDYVTACDSLTWMDGVTYHQSTQSAYFTLPSSTGCDSVICLNLNIPQINNTVSVSPSGEFSSNQNFASYQWLDCNNGFATLLGDTLQSFSPLLNGDYAVVLSVNGCLDTSVCININNVSIEEIDGNMIKLYPNPNNGKFMLDLGNLKATEVMIINSLGQIILVKHNFKSKYFDLALNPGVYFIQIQSDNYNKTIKFLVK